MLNLTSVGSLINNDLNLRRPSSNEGSYHLTYIYKVVPVVYYNYEELRERSENPIAALKQYYKI